MKLRPYSLLVGGVLALGTQAASAAYLDLTGIGYVQYGDAISYSLPVANYQIGESPANGPYTVQSSPGQISSLTVVGTGSSGNPVVTNFDGMDNAYATPSGVNGETFWYPNPYTYQGTEGTVNNNGDYTWDVSLSALNTFLAGGDMIVYFNNNQIGADGAASESLAAWARVWVTDEAGNELGDFYLTNDLGRYDLISQGGGGEFLGDPTTFTGTSQTPRHIDENQTDYVLSGGRICVAHDGDASVAPVPVACGTSAEDIESMFGPGWTLSSAIDHNLGADRVAYAILFPELNDLLAELFGTEGLDLSAYTMHADIRMGCDLREMIDPDPQGNASPYGSDPYGESFDCGIYNGFGTGLNNGYEQIFIGSNLRQPPVVEVPEPRTLALLGMALLVAGFVGRRGIKVVSG